MSWEEEMTCDLKEPLTVITVRGKDGVIGRVVEGKNAGMIVLFSNPPANEGEKLVCADYEIRKSKSGKNYIKCFLFFHSQEEYEEAKRICERNAAALKVEAIVGFFALREEEKEAVRDAISGLNPQLPNTIKAMIVAGKIEKPDDDVYVAVVKDEKVLTYNVGYCPGDVRVYTNDGYIAAQVSIERKIPGATYVETPCGVYIVAPATMERLVNAMKRLAELGLPSEIEAKVADKLVELGVGDSSG